MWKKTWKITGTVLAREEGATVVETTVIVPMIWVMIMGSTLLFFFFFDMGVIRSETIRCAQEVSQEWRKKGKCSYGEQKESLKRRINDRLLLADLESCDIAVSFGTVTVNAGIRFYLGGKGLSFTDTSKAAVDNREEWVRLLSR